MEIEAKVHAVLSELCVVCNQVVQNEQDELRLGKLGNATLLSAFFEAISGEPYENSYTSEVNFCLKCKDFLTEWLTIKTQIKELLNRAEKITVCLSAALLLSANTDYESIQQMKYKDSIVKEEAGRYSTVEKSLVNSSESKLLKRLVDARNIVKKQYNPTVSLRRLVEISLEFSRNLGEPQEKSEAGHLSDVSFPLCTVINDRSENIVQKSDVTVDRESTNLQDSALAEFGQEIETAWRPEFDGSESEEDFTPRDVYKNLSIRRKERFILVSPREFLYAEKFRIFLRDGNYECALCHGKSKSRKNIQRHIRKHHILNPVKRKIAHLTELTPGEYLYRDRYRFQFSDGNYACDLCGYVNANVHSVLRHIRTWHMPEESRNDTAPPTTRFGANDVQSRVNQISDNDQVTLEETGNNSDWVLEGKHDVTQQGAKAQRTKKAQCIKCIETGPGRFLIGGKVHIIRTEANDLKCEDCGLVKPDMKTMLAHVGSKHIRSVPFEEVENGFKCKTCGELLSTRNEAISHVKEDHRKCNSSRLVREIEPGLFEYKNYRFRYNSERKRYICELCSIIRTKRSTMMYHLRLDHINRAEKYVCETCGAEQKTFESLRHHRMRHRGEKHECPVCSRTFSVKDDLRGHMLIHKGDEAKKIVCEFCGKRFFKKNQLDNHKTIHTGEEPYSCTECGQSFQNRSKLSKHRKSAH